jgi:hypothetical protein
MGSKVRRPGHLKDFQLPLGLGAKRFHDKLASGSSRLGLMTGLVNQHRAAIHMQYRISGGTHVHVVAPSQVLFFNLKRCAVLAFSCLSLALFGRAIPLRQCLLQRRGNSKIGASLLGCLTLSSLGG